MHVVAEFASSCSRRSEHLVIVPCSPTPGSDDSTTVRLGTAESLHDPEDTGEHQGERLGVEAVTWGQRDHALGGN
jgi:hypothetical protein